MVCVNSRFPLWTTGSPSGWEPLGYGEVQLPHLGVRSFSMYPPTPLCHWLQTAPRALSPWCIWPALNMGLAKYMCIYRESLAYSKGQRLSLSRKLPMLPARDCGNGVSQGDVWGINSICYTCNYFPMFLFSLCHICSYLIFPIKWTVSRLF